MEPFQEEIDPPQTAGDGDTDKIKKQSNVSLHANQWK